METKQFKAESKRLLDLMINSIYTNKDIFLRELISNASDAIDKLYYRSLTEKDIKLNKEDFEINLEVNKSARTITISDNGCGMTEEELENNLGTIAKSGSLAFKQDNDKKEDIDIIGQFGVGFYSAFMVAQEITVVSKAYGAEKAYIWNSRGADGYTIEEIPSSDFGTTITLKLKDDSEDEKYSEYLEERKIKELVKRYSDYIRYPIKMEVEHNRPKEGTEGKEYEKVIEIETLNSMIPLWKKKKSDIKDEEYDNFYNEKFYDFQKPLKVIHTSIEGGISYNAILYIPSHAPYDFYSKDYEKGLQLYSNGVLIMDKCQDLLPEYFGFVKGLVDSPDLSLNISRELLQHDRQLKVIAKNIEKKIKSELLDMLKNDRENYEKFYDAFGAQLKFGIYNSYGMNKEALQDLLMFYSSSEKKLVTLDEYVERMKENQDKIYYACGETIDKIDMLPQVEGVKEKGFEILYFIADIDEFAMQMMQNYKEKGFANVSTELNLDSEEEKENLNKINEEHKDMFILMKEAIGDSVQAVKFTHRLKNHPVCLSTEGNVSVEMEKVLNMMPNDNNIKAEIILEINDSHPIADKVKELYQNDKETLKEYTKILYSQARLIEGLQIENPTEITNLICKFMSK